MMSKTHLSMGIATALTFVENGNIPMLLTAIVGGALGGITADIDILDNDNTTDTLVGQILALFFVAAIFFIDKFFNIGILTQILDNRTPAIIGIIAYFILFVYGFTTNHRTFTHSFLGILLFSLTIKMIYKPLFNFYLYGYLSHLILDLLNKKGVQLFYPFNFKPCLKICYANKAINKIFMYIGLVSSVGLIFFKIV